MSGSPTEARGLTPEQDAIAAAAPEKRLLVTAGAGTGKTYVLVERLAWLADTHDLSLADDVLVLSFSRAVVWEIRRRMALRGGSVPYGTVSTFDSFASSLLARFSPGEGWTGGDFDGRVAAATQLLHTSEDAQQELGRLRHVIVDEVQDLVGVRRELVQEILTHSANGFTLFGDPAQGIYNFQADDPVERQVGSLLFFNWVKHKLPGTPVEGVSLSRNFRYETAEARVAEWAGDELNSAEPDYPRILDRLQGCVLDIEGAGCVDDLVRELDYRSRAGSLDGTTGILCRYNFEVLRVSGKLAEKPVAHHYQRQATDRSVPAWVARSLRDRDSSRLSRSRFEEIAATVDDAPQNAWALLRRLDPRGARDSVDIAKVQERIRLNDVPAEFTTPPSAPIVVSTVHRAKGLEFDRVVLFEPGETIDETSDDLPERTRELYVALTRAKREYRALKPLPRENARRRGNAGDVWTVRGFRGGGRTYVTELEIRSGQAWSQDPAGAFAFKANAEETQQYIDRQVKPLDPLVLRRVTVEVGDGPRFYYVMEHEDRGVGVVDIGWIIYALCRPKYESNWPSHIDGVFVESIDTVAGTSAAGTRAGLTSSGLWLRVRPYGLGKFHWDG